MTNEEIRKLLGGYATNTLTEAERKVLFEAALDNQELFNAMQEEQALKDLLADPVSREQVRQALEIPASRKTAAWWSQWWAWGSAASALVAAILIVTIIRWNPGQPHRQEVASVSATKPADQPPPATKEAAAKSKPEPARAKTLRPPRLAVGQDQAKGQVKDEVAVTTGPPPAAPPAQVQEREIVPPQQIAAPVAPVPQIGGHSQNASQNASPNAQNSVSNQPASTQEQVQVSPAINGFRDSDRRVATTAQFATGLAGAVTGPLRFSLLKRDSNGDYVPVSTNHDLKKGDAVQLRVVPALSGYVSLSQLDQSGTWKRVFPSTGPGISVLANSSYSLPAIEVGSKDEKFRVTLSLATTETKTDTALEKSATSMKRAKAASVPQPAPETSPLFVDLTIGPKNQQ